MTAFEFNPKKAIKAQDAYCDEHEIPLFAPHDGLCFRCGRSIYLPTNGSAGSVSGFTVEDAGKKHITSCPHCNATFCD